MFEGFTHFVPTRFNLAVRQLLLGLVKAVPDARPIISSNPLVSILIVRITIIVWSIDDRDRESDYRFNFLLGQII